MSGLTQEDRELLSVAALEGLHLTPFGPRYSTADAADSLAPAVKQIIARHVREALEAAAVAVEDRVARNIGGHPFADRDRGLREAAHIIRADQP